jgi:predicted porin
LDINGNVNAFYIHNSSSDNNTVDGGLANKESGNADSNSGSTSINTGLLPSWLGVTGKTRQNDLDVSFTMSFQQSASSKTSLGGGNGSNAPAEFRQASISFGDKSWGTIKIGKDLGVFGSDAILNDMTLLGVGSQGAVGTAGGTTTTLGRIGTGYLYADFNGQINYTSPNFNGFQFTVGVDQPLNTNNLATSAASTGAQSSPAFVGLASYSFAGDVAGKVWAEAKTQNVEYASNLGKERATAFGIGANVNVAGFGLTGYYYDAEGVGTTAFLMDGVANVGGQAKQRDSDGGYVQATYTIPGVGTKLGVSWGISKLDEASGEVNNTLVKENEMTTVGVYHPLTKHLNLVGEYSRVKSENQAGADNESDIVSAGAILFF